MGMTIDEAKVQLSMQKFYVLGKDYEAVQVAIETMRKYQKIQEIYERYQKDGDYYHYMAWLDVMEVLEDGQINALKGETDES